MLIRFFSTAPKGLTCLAITSLALLLIKVFFLNTIVEPFRFLNELGIFFEGILASIFASYVFYLIVVHIKEHSDRAVIFPHIIKWSRQVVGGCKHQLDAFGNATGITLDLNTLTKDAVNTAFSKIAPYSEAPLVFSSNQKANWIQYLDFYRTRNYEHIQKILAQLIFVDAKLVALLTVIDDSGHFSTIRMAASTRLANTDLSAFAPDFYKYCVACRDLETHIEKTIRSTEMGSNFALTQNSKLRTD